MSLTTSAKLQIKSCAVVLERLDEKLLSKYLQKYDSNTTGTSLSTSCNNSKENISQKQEKSEKSFIKTKFIRKRRKIKSLCYIDHISASESKKKKFFINKREKVFEDAKKELPQGGVYQVVSPKTGNARKTTESSETREINHWKDSTGSSLKWKEKSRVEDDEINLKNMNSNSKEADNRKNSDYKIEVIQETSKPSFSQEKINTVKRELANGTFENAEYDFEGECDIREDNEDDRITIIFEKSPRKEMDSDFFEIDEREIECPTKKFKSKEKIKLTDLEDYSEVFRKPEIRIAENFSGEKASKRSELNMTYYYLQKFCSLVKRLYESFLIIIQLKKELPKNDELAVHFSKVIKVQKENFFREIERSHKTIIECFEKLLAFYGNNANEVISEVSQHAFLKVEDVSRIISQCFLVNEIRSRKKNTEKHEKQNVFQKPTASDSSRGIMYENILKPTARNKIHEDSYLKAQSHSFFPSESFNLPQKPINEPVVSFMVSARKHSVPHSQRLSNPAARSSLPSYDNYQLLRQNSSPTCAQQEKQDQVMDPRLAQHDIALTYSGFVSWYSDSLVCSGQPSNVRTHSFHPNNIKPTMSTSFSINPTINILPQNRPNPESSISIPLYVHHFYLPNHVKQKSCSQESSESNFSTPVVQNISTCIALQPRNNMQKCSFAFSSNTHNRVIDVQRKPLISSSEAQRPSEDSLNRKPSELFVNGEEIFGKHCNLKTKLRTEFQNTSNKVTQVVLDPTVPQKLTMRNYRLQAEPTLKQETKEEVLETVGKFSLFQPFKEEEKKDRSELSEEKLKPRVYVCAHSDCKMPGLRICKGCQTVIYCSETCQLKHWVLKHKAECYQLRELRGA